MSILFLIFLSVFHARGENRKPAKHYFEICHRKNDFNECLKKALTKMKPILAMGIPELHMPSIEPLKIPKIKLGDGSGYSKLLLILQNMNVYGLSSSVVKAINLDLKRNYFYFNVLVPRQNFDGEFLINGRILVFPIRGNGSVVCNMTDLTIINHGKLEEYTKEGSTYIRIKENRLTLEPKTYKSVFTNLFNGDKTLGEVANQIINDNWKEIYSSYRELPEKAFADFFKVMINNVFSLFPRDELFPY